MWHRTRSRRRPRQNLKPSLSPPAGPDSIFKNKIFKLTILLIYLQYSSTSSVFVEHLKRTKQYSSLVDHKLYRLNSRQSSSFQGSYFPGSYSQANPFHLYDLVEN